MTTLNDISRATREIYTGGSPARRLMTHGRPYICPFEVLVDCVPQGSTVLDVGCGDGLFLNLLVHLGTTTEALGFDANTAAIDNANRAKANLANSDNLRFQHLSVGEPWPDRRFDLVAMIDVLHHIPVADKREVIREAASHVGDGGIFLFKDIGERPRWRAMANSLHDWVLTGERVSYTPLDTIVSWAGECGLQEQRRAGINRLWYGHELVVFKKAPNK